MNKRGGVVVAEAKAETEVEIETLGRRHEK